MNNITDKFFDDMADDFFAECDELLAHIRSNLLIIDNLAAGEKPQKKVMEDLLRSCHTLKGLTGMVGAEKISRLTHTLENYLKASYQNNSVISKSTADLLFRSIGFIEKQLESMRGKTTVPEGIEVLNELNELLSQEKTDKPRPATTISDSKSAEEENASAKTEEGENVWIFFFNPSRELFEKGININVVRSRLNSIGKIISSSPKTTEDGNVTFEFTVTTDKPESFFREWSQDGITYEEIPGKDSSDGSSDVVRPVPFQKNIVRVDLSKLENLMRSVGDLVISRSRLNDQLRLMSKDSGNLYEINQLMERQLKDLREGIMKLRLVPVSEAFERLRYAIRDLVSKSGKMVNLLFEGQDTQIDKHVMEKMFDPLLHLVRNAISHGIETPEQRQSAGKPAEGSLLLKASASGNSVIFEISDDGSGIDRLLVKEKALRTGILKEDVIPDNALLLEIISKPGFSTREESDLISGRGIGMDVVTRTIEELGGTAELETEKGKGTRFIIQLPLTLSIVDALIVKSGGHTFAIPMPVVNEIISFDTAGVIRFETSEMIPYREVILPIIRLNEFFGSGANKTGQASAIVVGTGNSMAGIVVDSISGQREIVVRSLTDPLVKVEGISGATELGEGKVVLIIDAASLIRSTIRKKQYGSEVSLT